MIAAPRHGFVFFALSKAASTSIESAFAPYAQLVIRGPGMKHMGVRRFRRFIEPFLDSVGYPPESYETVCLLRHPVDWLASWWRYRSREQILDPNSRAHKNYTGDLTFDQFATGVMDRTIRLGRPSRFVSDDEGRVFINRIYKFEHIDALRQWLSGQVGKDVALPQQNVSPNRPLDISADVRERIDVEFAKEIEIYQNAL